MLLADSINRFLKAKRYHIDMTIRQSLVSVPLQIWWIFNQECS